MSSDNDEQARKELPQDEVKSAASKKKQRAQLVANLNVLLSAVKERPALYNDPSLSELRHFVTHVNDHPGVFIKGPPRAEAASETTKIPSLTTGFAKTLMEQRQLSLSEQPVLLVVEAHKQRRKTVSKNVHYVSHYWSVYAVDAEHQPVLLNLNSCLNDSAVLFGKGSIIRLSQYAAQYIQQDDDNTIAAVFVSAIESLGTTRGIPNVRPSAASFLVQKERRPLTADEDDFLENGPTSDKCNGEICSRYGVHFRQCVITSFDPSTLDLALLVEHCPIYEGPAERGNMSNKNKRFLLYYWYATEVYRLHGVNNRGEMPQCFVNAIRNLYPSPNAQYKGHVSKKRRG